MAAPTDETPVSDAISRCLEAQNEENFHRFVEAFLASKRVGILLRGVTEQHAGPHVTTASDQLTAAMFATPTGEVMIRACADPEAFRARFGDKFNALVDPRTALNIAWSNKDCAGVIVASAASLHSIPIRRDLIEQILAQPNGTTNTSQASTAAPSQPSRPWWKFWG